MNASRKVLLAITLLIIGSAAALGLKWQSDRNPSRESTPTISDTSPSTLEVDDNQPDPNPNAPKPAESTSESQVGYKGERVVSSEQKFSIVIPNGWKPVTKCTNLDYIFVVSGREEANMAYEENTKPSITETSCGDDSTKLFSVGTIFEAQNTDGWSDWSTNDGVAGKKRCRENVTLTGMNTETYLEVCDYQYVRSGTTYQVSYKRPDSSYKDRKELIDQVVRSLKFL